MFQTKDVEKIKIHILCSITVFFENHTVLRHRGKNGRAGQATDDNIMRLMLLHAGRLRLHTLKMCNTY
jgi:hypothetical protein